MLLLRRRLLLLRLSLRTPTCLLGILWLRSWLLRLLLLLLRLLLLNPLHLKPATLLLLHEAYVVGVHTCRHLLL